MAMAEYAVDDHVAILTMNNGENRFEPQFLNAMLDTFTEIEEKTDATALIIKSAHEKIFSNGIDLEWLAPKIQQGDTKTAKEFFYLLNRLFKRTLTMPLMTIACINGHAAAGGAIWSCAFDFRFMRSDRGYFFFPEVDLGIPFLPGMLELLKKAIPYYKMEEMHHTGVRLTAAECETHHIVTKAAHADTLETDALAFAKSLNKRRTVLAEMKSRLYRHIVHAIDVEDVPYIESEQFNIG